MGSPARDRPGDDGIEDQALAWYLRLKDPGAGGEDWLRFEDWLAADDRHGAAYGRVDALWQRLETPAREVAARQSRPRPCRRHARHRRWARMAVAASLVLTLAAGGTLWRDPGLIHRLGSDVATRAGESRTLALADGSELFLDFDSAADIDLSGDVRRVELHRGRAWFDVAPAGRPFVIASGGARVRVTGTRFGVARGTAGVEVTVEEGRVEVGGERGGADNARTLGVGEQTTVAAGRVGDLRRVDPAIELAWARGLVLFDRAGAGEVAEQLQRMLPGRVILDRSDFDDLSLSGSFPANDPQALLAALEKNYGVRVERIPGTLTWLRR
ncbi:anti-FecI sigma factor FecR [Salinisphaera sp. PC39]|uniref:FecR family protein n=1 Tax=Salinisphaera sp. PC39 TaxID=1304156 RepID=UPI003341CA2E